jgi:hypothetical protein
MNERQVQGFSATEVLQFTGYARAKPASSRWRYYPRVFMDLAVGRVASWNWAGFFLGWYWLLFRKLYLAALAAFGLGVTAALILVLWLGEPSFGDRLLFHVISGLLIAVFGNALYFRRFKQVLARERPRAIHPGVLAAKLECAGRVDWLVPILVFVAIEIMPEIFSP